MTQDAIMSIFLSAFTTALKLAGPLLIVSLVIGLIISVLQAATQVHEQTLTFVPKLLVVGIVLLFMGGFMMTVMGEFTVGLFQTVLEFM